MNFSTNCSYESMKKFVNCTVSSGLTTEENFLQGDAAALLSGIINNDNNNK